MTIKIRNMSEEIFVKWDRWELEGYYIPKEAKKITDKFQDVFYSSYPDTSKKFEGTEYREKIFFGHHEDERYTLVFAQHLKTNKLYFMFLYPPFPETDEGLAAKLMFVANMNRLLNPKLAQFAKELRANAFKNSPINVKF